MIDSVALKNNIYIYFAVKGRFTMSQTHTLRQTLRFLIIHIGLECLKKHKFICPSQDMCPTQGESTLYAPLYQFDMSKFLSIKPQTPAFILQCSYQPRHCGPGHNPFSIAGFHNKYGMPGRSYPCFHSPTGPGALRLRNRGVSYILHIILWPALLTFIFSILWCVIYCYCCGRNPEE